MRTAGLHTACLFRKQDQKLGEGARVHPAAGQEDFCGMGKMFPAQLRSVPQCRETQCGEPGLPGQTDRTTGGVYVQQPQEKFPFLPSQPKPASSTPRRTARGE